MQYKNTFYKRALFIAILSVGSVASFAWVNAASDSITSINEKEINKLKDEKETILAQKKAFEKIIALKNKQGATLAEQIEGLQAQIDSIQFEIDLTTQKIEELKAQIDSLNTRIAEKSILIDRQKRMLSELMRIYYSDYTSDSTPLFLTEAESLLYFKKEDWTADVSNKVSDLLDSVKTLRDSLASEHKAVNEKKAEVDMLYAELDQKNDALEASRKSKATLLSKTQAEEQKYEGLVDNLEKKLEALEQEIDDLEAGKSTEGLPSGNGQLAYPVKKVSISQGYGKTSFSKTAYSSGKHNGVDFTGPYGTTIYAAADGKVIGTGNLGKYAYGKWIAIDHGNGIVTLYGHLSSIGVSKGEKVDRGESIGKMGSTGYSTGNHLHFGVYSAKSFELVPSKSVKGLYIPVGATANPMKYF